MASIEEMLKEEKKHEDMVSDIVFELRKARMQKNMSVEDVSEKSGIPVEEISQLEAFCYDGIPALNLARIAEVLEFELKVIPVMK